MDPLTSQPSQEYPIRALVRHDATCGIPPEVRAQVRSWAKREDRDDWYISPLESNPELFWHASEIHLIINPTPTQIAEERAKAGLPAEPSEGGKDLEPSPEAGSGREDAPYRAGNYMANWWIFDEHEVCMGMSPRKEWAETLAEGMNLLAQKARSAPEAPAEGSPSLPSAARLDGDSGFIAIPCPEFLGRRISIRIHDRNLEYAEGSEGYQVPRSASIEEESLYETVKGSLTVAPSDRIVRTIPGAGPGDRDAILTLPSAPSVTMGAGEAMHEIRTKLRALDFRDSAVDEIMAVFIDGGWRPKLEGK